MAGTKQAFGIDKIRNPNIEIFTLLNNLARR